MNTRRLVMLGSIIIVIVLYIVGAAVLGTTPNANTDGATVARWFDENSGHVRFWLWMLTLGAPFFILAVALLREQLPPPYRDIFFAGGIAITVATMIQGWIWAGLSWHASQLEPATARTLLDVASYWGPALTSAGIMTVAPIAVLGLRSQAGLPRWLGLLAAVASIEQAIETITIFGHSGFIAPGGPMNLLLGAGLTLATLLALVIVVSRSIARIPTPAQHGS